MMMEMKPIRADIKAETFSRPFTHSEKHKRSQMLMSITEDNSYYVKHHYPYVQWLI